MYVTKSMGIYDMKLNILILIIYIILNNSDHELEAKNSTKIRFMG